MGYNLGWAYRFGSFSTPVRVEAVDVDDVVEGGC